MPFERAHFELPEKQKNCEIEPSKLKLWTILSARRAIPYSKLTAISHHLIYLLAFLSSTLEHTLATSSIQRERLRPIRILL